jgi:Glycosyltransferase family 87
MEPSGLQTRRAFSPDAVKLLLVFAIFDFVLLFLLCGKWILDFSSFYTVGRLILHGQGRDLFTPGVQQAFQHRVFGLAGILPFNHLAYEALLAVPFSLFPFSAALWLWRLFSLGLFLLSSAMVADIYALNRLHTAVLAMGFLPIAYAIVEGQDSAVLLLLVVLSLALIQRRRPGWAGLVLACALFKPHLVLPLAAFLLWKKGGRFLAGFCSGAALVLALSTLVTGLRGWQQLFSLWRFGESNAGHSIGVFAAWMPNLRGLVLDVGLHGAAGLAVLGAGSVLLCAASVWFLRNQQSPAAFYPPVIVLTCLISFHLNVHDLSLLMVPIAALFGVNTRRASIAGACCYSIVLFGVFGHIAYFSIVMCGVLWVTLRQSQVRRNPCANPA